MSDIDYGELAKKFDALAKSHRQMADAAISAANHMRKLRDQLEQPVYPRLHPTWQTDQKFTVTWPQPLRDEHTNIEAAILAILGFWPSLWIGFEEICAHLKNGFDHGITSAQVEDALGHLLDRGQVVRRQDWDGFKEGYKIVRNAV